MRASMTLRFALLSIVAAVSTASGAAQAPGAHAELALGYTFVHTNAPPGDCDCFSLNGGNATFAWPVKPGRFELVGDIFGGTSDQIKFNAVNTGYQITVTTYTMGTRYLPKTNHKDLNRYLQPFGEVLVGVGHATGSLAQGSSPAAANASAAFATNIGWGLDEVLNRRLSLRMVQVDYLLTTFDNGGNNHQNNLRVGGGLVLHF